MAFHDGEPHTYVTSCLQEGLRPQPTYDVRAFSAGDGRQVAVVEVEPLEAGPRIVRGTVYERVPGATVPVKDPARLAELFARGARAHQTAQRAADVALGEAAKPVLAERDEPDEQDEASVLYVALAVAAVSVRPDPGSRLFRDSTRVRIVELTEQLARVPYPLGPATSQWVRQDRGVVSVVNPMPYQGDWALSAFWNGAVAVGYRIQQDPVRVDSVVSDVIVPAYRTAVDVAVCLTARARSCHRTRASRNRRLRPFSRRCCCYRRSVDLLSAVSVLRVVAPTAVTVAFVLGMAFAPSATTGVFIRLWQQKSEQTTELLRRVVLPASRPMEAPGKPRRSAHHHKRTGHRPHEFHEGRAAGVMRRPLSTPTP